MSGPFVSRAAIKVVAESVGISNLSDDVADALAPDVEYRLRDLVQEAIKFQKHGRRETLTTQDINYALRLRNHEPLYGFTSPDPPRFCRALTPGVYYLEDPELNLSDMLAEPLPKAPLEPSFTTHWLAVNGVQPTIPQNPSEDDMAAAVGSRKRPREDEGAGEPGSEVVPLARHALTAEEQTWLERVTTVVRGHKYGDEDGLIDLEASKTLKIVLRGVANDASTQSLSPHLCSFVAGEVNASLRNLPRLTATMRLLAAMLRSAVLDVEPYLHQVRPAARAAGWGPRPLALCGAPLPSPCVAAPSVPLLNDMAVPANPGSSPSPWPPNAPDHDRARTGRQLA